MSKSVLFEIGRLEALLDSALEHASHAWNDFEKKKFVNRINPDGWPPIVKAPVGSDVYHFAAVIEYLHKAYSMVKAEQNTQQDVMEKVDKFLKK